MEIIRKEISEKTREVGKLSEGQRRREAPRHSVL